MSLATDIVSSALFVIVFLRKLRHDIVTMSFQLTRLSSRHIRKGRVLIIAADLRFRMSIRREDKNQSK